MFHESLMQYCRENDIELRNYSGRNYAKDCLGIILPNGNRAAISFIHDLTKKIVCEAMEKQQEDETFDVGLVFELLDEFVNGLEFDSMGRDDQVIYNREFKYAEFENLLNDGDEDE